MKSKNIKGFTVVEIMVAIVLAAIIILSAFNFYLSQQKFSVGQVKKAQLQGNLKVAMDRMVKDIRKAGYDPESSGSFGISSQSTTTEIRYTMDENGDGILDDGEEHRFRLDGTTLKYTKDANVGQPGGGFTWDNLNVAPIEITVLGFTYSDISDPVDSIYDVVDIVITGQIKMPLGSAVYETQTLEGKLSLRN